MRKQQANRAVIAARATISGPNDSGAVSRNLLLRDETHVASIRTGPVRRTTCAPMTAAMRSGEVRENGSQGRSLWSASPYMKDARMFDKRQDLTVSTSERTHR